MAAPKAAFLCRGLSRRLIRISAGSERLAATPCNKFCDKVEMCYNPNLARLDRRIEHPDVLGLPRLTNPHERPETRGAYAAILPSALAQPQ
jgi:hypothetical protein